MCGRWNQAGAGDCCSMPHIGMARAAVRKLAGWPNGLQQAWALLSMLALLRHRAEELVRRREGRQAE